jgi:hypothetical protein
LRYRVQNPIHLDNNGPIRLNADIGGAAMDAPQQKIINVFFLKAQRFIRPTRRESNLKIFCA